jgi:hypothetical protein
MKILVIGSSVVDEIHQNSIIEIKAGGVFYNVCGLLFNPHHNLEIDLITNFDEELSFYFNPIYNQVNFIKIDENRFMPKVNLYVHQDKEREEFYDGFSQSLTIPGNINYNDYDGILINMITGIDISSEIIAEIRNNYKGKIYLDLHSLSRGFDQSNNRVFRTINDTDKWLNNIDVLQCNQNELKTLYKSVEEKVIIEKVLSTNTKYLVITKGERGAELYSKNNFLNEEAANFSTITNSVGCGDIFGAVFFSSYISTNNIEFSLREGVKISSNFTQFKNVYEFLDKGIDLV